MVTTQNPASKYYHVGGSLPPNAPSYVKRKADDDLYNRLKAGEYCYVLNSRQMGKSSLRVQMMQRLKNEGFACASIDITGIGSDVTPEQWYGGLISKLWMGFNLLGKVDLPNWLGERQSLSPVQRLSEFIKDVILKVIDKNIVIFLDEIDSILKLKFSSDDFFAVIRFCYNKRAENSEYTRLTFVLLGVAAPSDLIQNKEYTPFNIGRAIQLNGFEAPEALPLAKGLEGKVSNPQAVLEQVLGWTGGQPFLTQKLCDLILKFAEPIPTNNEAKWVAQLVRLRVIKDWESQDDPNHLRTIRDRLLSEQRRVGRLLGLYKKILDSEDNKAGKVISDDSPEQWQLRLSGLVVKNDDELRVYNRIYKNVFGRRWVNDTLGNWQPYAKNITNWLASDCQDETFLLRENVLEDAVASAEDKSLSDEGYKFLIASLRVDRREIQAKLVATEERLENQHQLVIRLSTLRVLKKELLIDLKTNSKRKKNIQQLVLNSKEKLGKAKNTNQKLIQIVAASMITNLIILTGLILLSFIQNSWAIFISVLVVILLICFNYAKVSEPILKVLKGKN